MRYQDREVKLSAVNAPSNLLGNISPYAQYRSMFGMNHSSEVYYIYSSPTLIPSNDKFTTSKRDKNSVYFHQLYSGISSETPCSNRPSSAGS